MEILEYVLQFLPTLVALIGEIGIIKFAINVLAKAKETKEFKDVAAQNKLLISELREAKKLNKELLTQIDKIAREE